MAVKKGDTGNATNIDSHKKMVAELKDLGATFLPPTTDMTPAELDKRTTAADAAVKGVKAPKEIYDITVNLRMDETEVMDDHVRNALGNLQAIVDVKDDQKLRAKAIADLITGNARKKAPKKALKKAHSPSSGGALFPGGYDGRDYKDGEGHKHHKKK